MAELMVQWTESLGANSYEIRRDNVLIHSQAAGGLRQYLDVLPFGGSYSYTMTATNVSGSTASTSNPQNAFVITAPGTPTNLTASGGDTVVNLTWVPPAQNGGADLRQYQIGAFIGGIAQVYQYTNAPAASYTFTGLLNGTTYTFRIACDNIILLQSPYSADSNAVTPNSGAVTVPVAPTIGTASVPVAGQATVAFTPNGTGGSPILDYQITSSPGGITATVAGSPGVIPGLTNGVAYTFTVRARNAVGFSLPSAASNAVTPPYLAIAPAAPVIGIASGGAPGSGQATVTFTAPAYNGGPPPNSYTVTSSPGGLTSSGAGSPLVVGGLSGGVPYTFTVTATNANGTGPASAASNSVTLVTAPAAPLIGTATSPAAGQLSITFIPPNNGGSPITLYTATTSPGGFVATGAGSPILFTGLAANTYTVTVTATNAVGQGAASAASNSVVVTAGGGADFRVTATADARVTATADQRVTA